MQIIVNTSMVPSQSQEEASLAWRPSAARYAVSPIPAASHSRQRQAEPRLAMLKSLRLKPLPHSAAWIPAARTPSWLGCWQCYVASAEGLHFVPSTELECISKIDPLTYLVHVGDERKHFLRVLRFSQSPSLDGLRADSEFKLAIKANCRSFTSNARQMRSFS